MSAFRSPCIWIAVLAAPACVAQIPRLDEPARVQRIGLDRTEDDLVLVEVVHGVLPANTEEFLLRVPHDWQSAPVRRREDGRAVLDPPLPLAFGDPGLESPRREILFFHRDTYSWSAEGRARHRLLMKRELPREERREYEVANLRREDGSVDVEVRARHGASSEERVLAVLRLPPDLTPPELSGTQKLALGVPLALVDAAWIPICAASFVVLIPFGSLALFAPDSED